MQHGITRRDFLRFSGAALGALWVGSWLPAASKRVQAAAFGTPMAPPSFAARPNPAELGAPVDVAIGTDGVTWITSASGAPSTYDPVGQVWTPFGGGIDVAAYVPYRDNDGNYLVAVSYFRGDAVFQAGQLEPIAIAERWQEPPGLPPSFQTGIDGVVKLANNGAVLFRQGQAAFVLAGGMAPRTQSGAGRQYG